MGDESIINTQFLNAIFNVQVERLCERGYEKHCNYKDVSFGSLIEPLRPFVRESIEAIKSRTITCDKMPTGYSIPFLIVIPEWTVRLNEQVKMMGSSPDNAGIIDLNVATLRLADGVEVPRTPYVIFNVENGEATRGMSAEYCTKWFKKIGRLSLTVEEGIALVTQFPEILSRHSVDLSGSRVNLDDVPGICLMDGRPHLSSSWIDGRYDAWGSASCTRRM